MTNTPTRRPDADSCNRNGSNEREEKVEDGGEAVKESHDSFGEDEAAIEEKPPPLPPRPMNLALLDDRPPTSGSLKIRRPQLQSKATTALSFAGVQGQPNVGGDGESYSSPGSRQASVRYLKRPVGFGGSAIDDSASIKSSAPTFGARQDVESLLGEALVDNEPRGWSFLAPSNTASQEALFPDDPIFELDFSHEFDPVEELKADGSNEGSYPVKVGLMSG